MFFHTFTKAEGRFPVIDAESRQGQLLGFASYGTFRAWLAYKYTVENGIYIQKDHRGQGRGRTLMNALIERARAQDYHLIVAGIDAANAPSISLHQSLPTSCRRCVPVNFDVEAASSFLFNVCPPVRTATGFNLEEVL